ncbi:MAG: glutathione-disulfide reductase [Rhodospirillales bacterium]|nr:glutathione-disulfide reductase [Rhodospirillales bacterium]
MGKYDYDLFVIGAGSGGVRAGRMAAAHGAKVGVCEEFRVGGTCVIRGCIPKKLFVYASQFSEEFEDAAGFGWTVPKAEFSWARLIQAKDKEIDRLNGIYIRNLENAGAEIIQSRGVLRDAHTVELLEGGRTITAETILIATGCSPTVPEIPGIEHAITSNEAFHLAGLPKRVTIVGAGYIALEFAGIFNGLGADTTVLYRGEEILRGFDMDLRTTLHEEMIKKGVDVRVETDVAAIEKTAGGVRLVLTTGDTVDTDVVMYATGRHPHTAGLGLENAGVDLAEDGSVVVDEYSRTTAPNIYAVGDVTNRMQLTPVAIMEAMAFVDTVFRGKPTRPDHETVATAVFSQPEIGTVGLREDEARGQYGEVDIYRSHFRPLKHTLSGRDARTMMKLIVDPKSDRVLGLHMIGPDGGEIAQSMGIALKMGATKSDFDATMAVHPTAAEEFVTMREKVS